MEGISSVGPLTERLTVEAGLQALDSFLRYRRRNRLGMDDAYDIGAGVENVQRSTPLFSLCYRIPHKPIFSTTSFSSNAITRP